MDRIQLRRDTSANWAEVNPILLEGELGFEIDTKLRKIGDGVNRWNDLEYLRAEGIVQEKGNSENLTMSQDAITRELNELGSEVDKGNGYSVVVERNLTVGYYDLAIFYASEGDIIRVKAETSAILTGPLYIQVIDSSGVSIVSKTIEIGKDVIVPICIADSYTIKLANWTSYETNVVVKWSAFTNGSNYKTLSAIKTLCFHSSVFSIEGFLDSNGDIISNNNFLSTDFLRISKDSDIVYSGFKPIGDVARTLHFYNENKESIGSLAGAGYNVIKSEAVPDGATYIRFCTAVTELKENAYIYTFGLNDIYTQIQEVNQRVYSAEHKVLDIESYIGDMQRDKGGNTHLEKVIPVGPNVRILSFYAKKGRYVKIDIKTSEALDGGAAYYMLYKDNEKIATIIQRVGELGTEYVLTAPSDGEYVLNRNYTYTSSFVTTLDVNVKSEFDTFQQSIADDSFVKVVTKNPTCKGSTDYTLNGCSVVLSENLRLQMKKENGSTPYMLQYVNLDKGVYQVFIYGKCISVSDNVTANVLHNNTGLGYCSFKLNEGEEFYAVGKPVELTEPKSGSFYFTLLSENDGNLGEVELYNFGIAKVNNSFLCPSIIPTICDGKSHIIGLDSRMSNGYYKYKWVSLGDSITVRNSYQKKVAEKLTLQGYINLGVSGMTLSDNGSNGMCRDSYLSQIPIDANLITIMGGTNDFAQSRVIGDYNSRNTSEFCGALNKIIDYVTEYRPEALLVVLGTPLGISWGYFPNSNGLRNDNGLSTLDYAVAAEEVCKRRGIHYISTSSCGWTEKNMSLFFDDDGGDGHTSSYFHPNDRGYQRLASVIVGGLKMIEPLFQLTLPPQ